MATGLGLQLRYELMLLAKRHNIAPPVIRRGPRSAASRWPPDPFRPRHRSHRRSATHQIPRRWSLTWSPQEMPSLEYKHQPDVIGTITFLRWTPAGLEITAETDHPVAKICGGFSVAASIRAYELHNVDDRANYYAEVTSGVLEFGVFDRLPGQL